MNHMPHIVYFSNITNTTHRLVQKIGLPATRIPIKEELSTPPTEDYVLIIPTYGDHNKQGMIPIAVKRFLSKKENREHCTAVIATGNSNFGKQYCKAGDLISEKLGVPLLYKLELAGDTDDIAIIQNKIADHYQESNTTPNS
jgi:protein involved in ribonucleotide reduction